MTRSRVRGLIPRETTLYPEADGHHVEPVPRPVQEAPSAGTGTERGVWWLMLGLAAAIPLSLASLVSLFRAASFGISSVSLLFLLEDAAGLLVLGLGLVGFAWLRRGRNEHGPAHAGSLRRATIALLLTGASEALILVTGLLLGFGVLPRVIVIGVTYPPHFTLEWGLIMAHFAGYLLVGVFVGLFLLWSIWGLTGGAPRWIGLAALVAGVPTHIIALADVSGVTEPMAIPVGVYYVSWALPALSVTLWFVAYVLVLTRLRGAALSPIAGAAPL